MEDIAPNPHGYHVFKNFLTKEEAKLMADYINENSEVDPGNHRPHFRWMTIPGSEQDVLDEIHGELPWDPNKKIIEMLEFSRKFIEENYNLWGELHLIRIHGNIMDENAIFDHHRDEDPDLYGNYGQAKRTYVADLFVNDDYEGGLFEFYREVDAKLEPVKESVEKIKPEAGDLIIFPGYQTWHGIDRITKGSRINIMGIYFDIHPDADFNAVMGRDPEAEKSQQNNG